MADSDATVHPLTKSEFDLQPGEEVLPCGCYVIQRTVGRFGKSVITGQATRCDQGHRLLQEVQRNDG